MTDFSGIERRVKDECGKVGISKADQLERSVGKMLGYNPDAGTWWASEEYLKALAPLKSFARKRYADLEMQRVWHEAEKAAMDVLKREVK